ncbi:MAG TPA: acyltransferase family protein [Candidatus Angelobacter sp.]|jgi:peptidoglycan/LPS O-acetylase OafA/YrhL
MAVSVQHIPLRLYESEPTSAPHLEYRPDVDGLRAIAVLAVIVFHAFPALLPGGFVGVDVFFVISGFLISGIILRGLSRERFSVLEFYGRRIKRIFPALIVMLAGVWALGRAMLLADEFQRLGKHVYSGAGFMFNLTLYMDTKPYFGAITSPLIHLWSLGVEEQFYLFWPLFLLATWKLGKKQFGVMVAVAVVSFILNIVAVSSHPLAAFYLPWNRLWELALGGVLAYAQLNKAGQFDQRDTELGSRRSALAKLFSPSACGAIGVLLILASCVVINERRAFPGWWALGPCLGAFLLISAGPQSWINRHVLSQRAMVFIGLISYPLYLWHWPLLSFAHTANWRGFTPAIKIAAVAASFVLATVTYKYIERPIRSSPKVLRLAAPLFATMLACFCVGYMTFKKNISARPLSADISKFVQAAKEPDPYPRQEGFLTIGSGSRSTLYIGDSTVAQYYGRISKVQKEHSDSHKAVFAWQAGCAPDPELSLINAVGCQKLIQSAVEYAKDPKVDTVVIGFCWYAYFVGYIQPDRVGEAGPLVPATDRALTNIKSMITGFVNQGKRVYVVLQLPVDGGFPPRQMIRRTVFGSGFRVDSRPAERASIARAVGPFASRLIQIANDTGAQVIDPLNALCNERDCSPVTPGGDPIYHDSWHLRSAYIRDHIDYMDATILDASDKPAAKS